MVWSHSCWLHWPLSATAIGFLSDFFRIFGKWFAPPLNTWTLRSLSHSTGLVPNPDRVHLCAGDGASWCYSPFYIALPIRWTPGARVVSWPCRTLKFRLQFSPSMQSGRSHMERSHHCATAHHWGQKLHQLQTRLRNEAWNVLTTAHWPRVLPGTRVKHIVHLNLSKWDALRRPAAAHCPQLHWDGTGMIAIPATLPRNVWPSGTGTVEDCPQADWTKSRPGSIWTVSTSRYLWRHVGPLMQNGRMNIGPYSTLGKARGEGKGFWSWSPKRFVPPAKCDGNPSAAVDWYTLDCIWRQDRLMSLLVINTHINLHPLCLKSREAWWRLLEQVLQGIPNRHSLVLLGDFNCYLAAQSHVSGTDAFHWQHRQHTGTIHTDHARFGHILRNFALTALNTWSSMLGPTYVHGEQGSRLDYICVRQAFADGEARQTKYLWSSPFLDQTTHGHVPMLCTIARYWIPPFAQSISSRVSLQQRQTSREAYVRQTAEWTALTQATQSQLNQLFQRSDLNAHQLTEHMHSDTMPAFCQAFPPGKAASASPAWLPALPTILNKWEHRRAMLQPGKFSVLHVFRVWFHATKFAQLKRIHRRQAKSIRAARFQEVVHSAAAAAAQHNTHKLFHIINQFAPKQPRRQIQLRNHAGHMATPVESAALLNQYVAATWEGPSTNCFSSARAPGVPFTVQQLARALQLIPATKAAAKHCVPGVLWKQHAEFLAPLLHAKLGEWWNQNPPCIPDAWRQGWLFMIPKPSKAPVTPSNLRPLVLQDPIGKAVIGLLIQIAMHQAKDFMVLFPLWAYVEHRSTLDAIRRVSLHCALVRQFLLTQRSTPHSRAVNTLRYGIYGGFQLCLDLKHAFDNVDRRKLFQQLPNLHISEEVAVLLSTWHEHTTYVVQHDDGDCPIPTGRGVRQGCKAAPGLWNCFVLLFCQQLLDFIPLTWIQQNITVYADDFHIGAVFTSYDEFRTLQKYLGIIFLALQNLDMQINPQKSVILFELRGTQGRRLRRRFVRTDHAGECFKIEVPGDTTLHIPIQKSTKYLGVIISYTNFEDDSLKHRLTLMKVAFHRLRKWLTGKHILSMTQRYKLWQVCVYPVFSYGVFAMGLTPAGIRLAVTQITLMLRKIIHDHSYITRHSNALALALHQIPHPARLLHGTANSLLNTVSTRAALLPSHDLVHTITWTHLPDLLRQLDDVQATSLETSQPFDLQACSDRPFYQCACCDFCTASPSAFRCHCTTAHDMTLTRTRYVDIMQFSVNGLPTCKLCNRHFTTWRMFQSHLERGCQEQLIGPAPCVVEPTNTGPALGSINPMQQPADVAMRSFRLITADELHNLRQQDFGERLLNIVAERSWEQVAGLQPACRYLSRRCFICSFQFSRCQELHQHYRSQHMDLWEFVPQKAIQLTNLYSTESPCECCGSLFRTHMCPTWTQLAVMLVTGAGREATELHGSPEVSSRCEICLEAFANTSELVQHLQTAHALQGLSFNPGRDSLNNESACSHCGKVFDTMSGLKSHIVQGRCAFFNPQASAETLPVHDLWSAACLEGQFLTVLKAPANRMRLTVTCQACGKGCQRAADLALHLQTAHARLWRRAQRLTMQLVDVYYPIQCYCNPSLGVKRANHICLPFRQLAMAFHRLGREPFAPMLITDQVLHSILSPKLHSLDKHRIEHLLAQRQFSALWQDIEVLHTLSCSCLFCGINLATSDLTLHLREEHPCKHDTVVFYMEQLLPMVHALNTEDYKCQLCRLIYNLPSHLRPDETLAERQALAQSHLKGSCPVLLQLSLLFASLLYRAIACNMDTEDLEMSGEVRDAFGALAPLLQKIDSSLRLAPNPRSAKTRRKGDTHNQGGEDAELQMDEPRAPQMLQLVKTLTQLVVRHDQELQSLRRMDQFILFLNHEPKGALHILLQETEVWRKQREQGPQTSSMPLRQHLIIALLRSLQQRAGQIVEAKETDPLYVTSVEKGLILADRSFPFHKWDASTQKLAIDKKTAVSSKKMHQHLKELLEMMQDGELIIRFHALRSPNEQQKIIPWRLQFNLRSDRPFELLHHLAKNSVWMAVGASMKQHTLHQTPLATTLQSMMGGSKAPPKGKGRGKSNKQTKWMTRSELGWSRSFVAYVCKMTEIGVMATAPSAVSCGHWPASNFQPLTFGDRTVLNLWISFSNPLGDLWNWLRPTGSSKFCNNGEPSRDNRIVPSLRTRYWLGCHLTRLTCAGKEDLHLLTPFTPWMLDLHASPSSCSLRLKCRPKTPASYQIWSVCGIRSNRWALPCWWRRLACAYKLIVTTRTQLVNWKWSHVVWILNQKSPCPSFPPPICDVTGLDIYPLRESCMTDKILQDTVRLFTKFSPPLIIRATLWPGCSQMMDDSHWQSGKCQTGSCDDWMLFG